MIALQAGRQRNMYWPAFLLWRACKRSQGRESREWSGPRQRRCAGSHLPEQSSPGKSPPAGLHAAPCPRRCCTQQPKQIIIVINVTLLNVSTVYISTERIHLQLRYDTLWYVCNLHMLWREHTQTSCHILTTKDPLEKKQRTSEKLTCNVVL